MRVVELCGGVGGARLGVGLAALEDVDLTIVVNVGDDDLVHGLAVSPDLDTVVYTLAGVEGPLGWGRAGDSFRFNDELARFGVDTSFRLGDLDLAVNVYRTRRLAEGASLSTVTVEVCTAFGVATLVVPASDEPVRTMVRIEGGEELAFQEYFVARRAEDTVAALRFEGAEDAKPAPGVLDGVADADVVVIGPSNPPLSIWPILSIPGIREAVATHPRVVAVSPLIGGRTVKGPAARVMASLGLPPGNAGVVEAYRGLLDGLVIDESDDPGEVEGIGEDIDILSTPTLIEDPEEARRLAREIVAW
ncbi:MAG: 2-phospho-L-lactate transferase [Actinobacteria bacterium]|nr:2-phospho-L-lactate transferase [Actinomycetota bacterium]